MMDKSVQLELLLLNAKASSEPTLDPILQLHRAPDSYVTFHKFRDGKIVGDCSVKVDTLTNYFPEFRSELNRDGFYSLNGFFRPGNGNGLAGLPRALRNSSSARYLNVNFVVIVCHL